MIPTFNHFEFSDDFDEEIRSHLAIIEKRAEEVKSSMVKLISADEIFREADAILNNQK